MFFTTSDTCLPDAAVCSANLLTSAATTANPLPAYPALAASIDAFSESKLVCSAIPVIIPII